MISPTHNVALGQPVRLAQYAFLLALVGVYHKLDGA
jgi:hypothetical protein